MTARERERKGRSTASTEVNWRADELTAIRAMPQFEKVVSVLASLVHLNGYARAQEKIDSAELVAVDPVLEGALVEIAGRLVFIASLQDRVTREEVEFARSMVDAVWRNTPLLLFSGAKKKKRKKKNKKVDCDDRAFQLRLAPAGEDLADRAH